MHSVVHSFKDHIWLSVPDSISRTGTEMKGFPTDKKGRTGKERRNYDKVRGEAAMWESASVQLSLVTQSCPTLCEPMNHSTPGLPVHHQLPEFTQTHVHWISDAIQPSHPRSSLSPPALNPSQHQSLFQWANSLHEVAKVLEFQLQDHSLQRNPRADLL